MFDTGEVQLSEDQERVLASMVEFIREPGARRYITVGGYAGTGKTTILGKLTHLVNSNRIAFCAYTGKAASVLSKKLPHRKYCGTIHGLMYYPILDEKGKVVDWGKRDADLASEYDLIVIDEASMVSEQIFKDLLEYEIPIIAVGDHGQLPPVKSSFNLMQHPMYRLEKVHRQAEGDPIIKLSIMARTIGGIPIGEYGEKVRKVKGMEHLNGIELDDVLCLAGTNAMRQKINSMVLDGREKPQEGDKVICLKNNAKKGIYNGMVGFVRDISKDGAHWYRLRVEFEDGFMYEGRVLRYQFGEVKTAYEWRGSKGEMPGDLFDWAWCLTVHKAQGSEANSVVLIEEHQPWLTPDEWKRWIYTAVTRAKEELLIIKP